MNIVPENANSKSCHPRPLFEKTVVHALILTSVVYEMLNSTLSNNLLTTQFSLTKRHQFYNLFDFHYFIKTHKTTLEISQKK